MTQNEKDILLKDLCARLPYGVKVKDTYYNYNENYQTIWLLDVNTQKVRIFADEDWQSIEYIKPYLFPLSSMTAEQKEFIKNKFCYDWDIDDHPYSLWAYCIGIGDMDELIDWFHKNHIDYRGLIPMGLAIDATGLNIY